MPLTPDEQPRFDKLYAEYADKLIEHVRQHLRKGPKAATGGPAVAASAWASLMGDRRKGEVFAATTPDGIWEVLRKAVQRHCEKHNKRWQRHPTPSLEAMAKRGEDGERLEFQPLAREETPLESVVMAEEFQKFVSSLPEREQQLLAMHDRGLTPEQMADQLGTDPATVEEKLQQVTHKQEAFGEHLEAVLDRCQEQAR